MFKKKLRVVVQTKLCETGEQRVPSKQRANSRPAGKQDRKARVEAMRAQERARERRQRLLIIGGGAGFAVIIILSIIFYFWSHGHHHSSSVPRRSPRKH